VKTRRFRFNMKHLSAALLVVGTALLLPVNACASGNSNKKFDKAYLAQLQKTNSALKEFGDAPCDGNLQSKADALFKETDALHALFSAIPDSETDLQKAFNVELAYGFVDLLNDTARMKKNQCAESDPTPVPDKHPIS
jgi:hypothetical protein